MQTTAILLNHMYTCEPEAEVAEHLDTDYLILDWLKTKGHCANANISLDAVREAEEAPETQQGEANRVNWQQDYHDFLLRAMVCPCPVICALWIVKDSLTWVSVKTVHRWG